MNLDVEQTPQQVDHLNPFGLVIRDTKTKGRGVFATQSIKAGTVVDISPVLLFPKENYATHAKYTIVDDYAFVWGDGHMALALGLGSMMNHDESPNVSYSICRDIRCIKFTTMKSIQTGDELCIYYGSKLWFPSDAATATLASEIVPVGQEIDGLAGISLLPDEDIVPSSDTRHKAPVDGPKHTAGDSTNTLSSSPSTSRSSSKKKPKSGAKEIQTPSGMTKDPSVTDIVAPDDLPFERFKFPDEDDVESDDGPIPTMDIWATIVLEPKKIGLMLEHIRLNAEDYQAESLNHLKRIRRITIPENSEPLTQLALSPCSGSTAAPPVLPLPLSNFVSTPVVVTVPSTHAVNQIQLARKTALWPVCYYPMLETKKEKEWTKQEVEWMREGTKKAAEVARKAKEELGELPIGAYVTSTFDPELPAIPNSSWTDHDTRQSTHHPLRHACMNIIRKIASSDSVLPQSKPSPTPEVSSPPTGVSQQPSYLLTGYTLFITHEPCIMCCMALLHSRVKNVVYIKPMPKTGGLGGRGADGQDALVTESVPGLKGVNHRFGIWRWTEDMDALTAIGVDQVVDA